jgi:ATP-binding cassette, subfamily B, bacterial
MTPDFLLERHYQAKKPVRTLVYLLSPDRWRLLWATLLFIAKHSPVWILPLIFSDIINIVTAPEKYPIHRLWMDGLFFFLLVMQNIPTHTAHVRMLSLVIRRLESDLRSALVRKLQQLSIGFLENQQAGAIQSKILRDVEAVQGLCHQLVGMVLYAGLSILYATLLTLFRKPVMALFFFVTVPIAVGLVRVFRREMHDRNRAFRKQIEAMSARIAEMITMIPVTRAHAIEETEIGQIGDRLAHVRRQGYRLDFLNALFGACGWVLSQSMQLLCLLTCGYMAYHRMIPPGDVVLYNSLFAMIVGSILGILDGLPGLTRGFESVRSIGELLESPDMERNEGKAPVPAVQGLFVFDHVSFQYPSAPSPALEDFSLDVQPGEMIAVVGESGSGKTTMMSLVIGFRRPTAGKILLDGRDMETLDLRQYRKFLAVVPQQTHLFSGSLRDNITYGLPGVADEELQRIITMSQLREYVNALPAGLDSLIGESGVKLSGGQRQRVAIARALIRNPRVIILDEATSSLDVKSERLLQHAIEELVKGRTTFIVAHRLSTIRNASRVVVMKDSRCVEIGRPADLQAAGGEFARLRTLQV